MTYVSVNPSTWSSIEQSVGVICACLPTLRPLVRTLYGSSKANSEREISNPESSSNRASFPLQGPSREDEENNMGALSEPPCVQRTLEHGPASPSLESKTDQPGRDSWLQEEIRVSQCEAGENIPRPISFA